MIFLLSADFIKKKNQKFLSGTLSVPNSLEPDQALQKIGPDLVPNCLQKSAADDKVRS